MKNKPEIYTASYIGKPTNNTVTFIAKKVEHLLINLEYVEQCIVFYEETITIPENLRNKHWFIKTKNPQLDYAKYVHELEQKIYLKNKNRKYTLAIGGYYIGENVTIGSNTNIEPLCFIDHDVIIGDNARILSGSKIRNSIIGDNFISNENSVIGSYGFTMANDENGNKIRLPSLGKVIIGNNVEIGMLANISVGSGGNTVIEDFVKIDAFVHIAHDDTLKSNVEIPAGVIIGGFVTIEKNVFIGINSTIRNRITIGENSIVGMGSVVTKDILPNTTVIGNPARPFMKP